MWILTREENDYYQWGEYFGYAWARKPSKEKLKKVVRSIRFGAGYSDEEVDQYTDHVLKGGGRLNEENTWLNLFEFKGVYDG